MTRKCSMCGGYKEEEQYRYLNKQKRYHGYCKDCERLYLKEYMRIYREKHKEEIREYQKKYREKAKLRKEK